MHNVKKKFNTEIRDETELTEGLVNREVIEDGKWKTQNVKRKDDTPVRETNRDINIKNAQIVEHRVKYRKMCL